MIPALLLVLVAVVVLVIVLRVRRVVFRQLDDADAAIEMLLTGQSANGARRAELAAAIAELEAAMAAPELSFVSPVATASTVGLASSGDQIVAAHSDSAAMSHETHPFDISEVAWELLSDADDRDAIDRALQQLLEGG